MQDVKIPKVIEVNPPPPKKDTVCNIFVHELFTNHRTHDSVYNMHYMCIYSVHILCNGTVTLPTIPSWDCMYCMHASFSQ